jgi:hypothetical protein
MYDIAKQILQELLNYYIHDNKLEIKLSGKEQKIIIHNGIYEHIFLKDMHTYVYDNAEEILKSDELVLTFEDLIEILNKDKSKFEVKLIK